MTPTALPLYVPRYNQGATTHGLGASTMWLFWLVVLAVVVWVLARTGSRTIASGRSLGSTATVNMPITPSVATPSQAYADSDDEMVPTEVFIGGTEEATGLPVPPRPLLDPDPAGLDVRLKARVSAYGPEAEFLRDAKRYETRTHGAVPHVPFQSYWPTYRDMTVEQASWYYYWRARLREGSAMSTDMSYLFIHIYECLHGVGFRNNDEAFAHLRYVWQEYRHQHPKLDNYLQSWLLDMNAYYRLDHDPFDLVDTMCRLGVAFTDSDLQLAAWLRSRDFESMTPSMLRSIAGYDPHSGKFYKEFKEPELIDRTLRLAAQAVDVFYQTRSSMGVFETFQPQALRRVEHTAFTGAVFAYTAKRVLIASVPALSSARGLSELMESVLKQAENVLRKQVGFPGQRRGIQLPADLDAYLQRVLGSTDSRPIAKPIERRVIQIDLGAVAGLHEAAAKLREQLAEPPAPSRERAWSTRFDLPLDTPAGQLTDVDRIADVLDRLPAAELGLIHALRAATWVLDGAATALMARVNEAAMLVLGEYLVATEGGRSIVADDYRDELDFLLARDEYAAPAAVAAASEAGSERDVTEDSLAGLRERLTPLQVEVLGKILTGCPQRELARFALAHSTMASLVLDQINQEACEVIGDNLIDTYEDPLVIYEEHRELVGRVVAV